MMMHLHASPKNREGRKKAFLTHHLYPIWDVCAAAVVADLPRVSGEAETIVGLGLN